MNNQRSRSALRLVRPLSTRELAREAVGDYRRRQEEQQMRVIVNGNIIGQVEPNAGEFVAEAHADNELRETRRILARVLHALGIRGAFTEDELIARVLAATAGPTADQVNEDLRCALAGIRQLTDVVLRNV